MIKTNWNVSPFSTLTIPGARRAVLAAGLLVGLSSASLAGEPASLDESWPQWRGPARNGASPGQAWPDSLAGLEQAWRVELGEGYPGPIVANGRVFVVESVEDSSVAVRALELSTGKELWSTEWPSTADVPFFAAENGDWVRSTPATDGEAVYAGDMLELFVALDAATGEELWKIDFPERFGTNPPPFGFASSPLIDGEHLYLQAADSLIKLDKRTGEVVWRVLEQPSGMASGGAFSSPIIDTVAGKRQLIVLTRQALNGVDPADGSVLWTRDVPHFRGMHILTPVVYENSIFTSPYRQASFMYSVSSAEGSFAVEESWTSKSTAYMSSPVVIDGHLYMHLGNRRFECIDLATGESKWRSDSFGKYWSLTHRGDKILALGSDGALHLVRATPSQFELLDTREVSKQEAWGHLAVVGDHVLVRELTGIAAYRFGATAKPGGALPAK